MTTSRTVLLATCGAVLTGAAACAAATTVRVRRGIAASNAAVPVNAEFWRQDHHAEGDLLYAALGDSAGQAIGTDDPLRGYVGTLAQRIAEATGRSVAVANLCVSGARAVDVVEHQLAALAALPRVPDVVTCVIGGNDVYFRTAPGDFAAAFARLVDALPAGTVLGDVPCFRLPVWEGRVRRLNRVVEREAERAGLMVAPIHAVTHQQGWRTHVANLSADMFHPNERGYALWADALWALVEEQVPTAG